MKFWNWLKNLIGFPTPQPQPPSPPPPVEPPAPVKVYGCTDPVALNYNPRATDNDGTCQYPVPFWSIPDTFNGFNGARSLRSDLKVDGKYWYEVDLGIWKSQGGPFNVFRNGGTVTMGARFDMAYTGNGYAKSVGTWPAIFSPERRAEIGTIPSLSEFVSNYELQIDAREPFNYHYNIKQAQGLLGFKILYVANPFQDADELRAVIQYFGPSNFVGIVAGNEMNSPKAVRYGIKPSDVVYWAQTLRPVCDDYGLLLGVGLPPYEYQDKLLKGEPLGGKLAADKAFADHIAANAQAFDFACIHPYGQLPAKAQAEPFETWAAGVTLANDLDFLQVQVAHFYQLTGLPLYLDEHGLEMPEYGHVNSDLAYDWHMQRYVAMLKLSLDYPILGSCLQLLIVENPGQPQSLLYDEAGVFTKSRELQGILDNFNVTGIREADGFAVETDKGKRVIIAGELFATFP